MTQRSTQKAEPLATQLKCLNMRHNFMTHVRTSPPQSRHCAPDSALQAASAGLSCLSRDAGV